MMLLLTASHESRMESHLFGNRFLRASYPMYRATKLGMVTDAPKMVV